MGGKCQRGSPCAPSFQKLGASLVTGIFIRNYATILEHIHAHPSSEGVT